MRRNPPAEERLAAMGAPRDVVELVAAAPEDVKPLLFNAYRKDPGVSAEKLQAILNAAGGKRGPTPREEKLVADLTDNPKVAKWLFIEMMKHRADPGYRVADLDINFVVLKSWLIGVLDWATATRADLRRYTFEQAGAAMWQWHQGIGAASSTGLAYRPLEPRNVVARWPDGWTMQEITSENDVYVEGDLMQHCLRRDRSGAEYWRLSDNHELQLFSLRDERNNPHVTIDVRGKVIAQLYGKQNKRPEWKYMERVIEWLPKDVYGDLDLSGYKELTSLPERLTAWEGTLDIRGTGITTLPKDIRVDTLVATELAIRELPIGFKTSGSLDLTGTPIRELPAWMKVGGSLSIAGTSISWLPKFVSIAVNFNAYRTPLRALPDDLYVGGGLNLGHTRIERLPENMKRIGGVLYLQGTPIRELSPGLKIFNDLDVTEALELEELPDGLWIGGSLLLGDSGVRKLPRGLHVGGSFYLGNSLIRELPEDLYVGDNLFMGNARIAALPEDLKLKGEIRVQAGSPLDIDHLPKRLKDKVVWTHREFLA